ncbi:uncharacterized protein LOC110768343 [Prunus avium]|uniref:Uncharacterized protein LOC110768343 n=1 Tax=Prunus avium TaxID=42229 RepID=A0A6P5TL32_PRUAV|nr:uncharacterized protein LOC110768343 [Prunus avium]
MSQHEIDDIERAMRLSLLDLCRKGKNKNENESSYDEDGDLAEAILRQALDLQEAAALVVRSKGFVTFVMQYFNRSRALIHLIKLRYALKYGTKKFVLLIYKTGLRNAVATGGSRPKM